MTFGMQKDCEINLDFAGGVLGQGDTQKGSSQMMV